MSDIIAGVNVGGPCSTEDSQKWAHTFRELAVSQGGLGCLCLVFLCFYRGEALLLPRDSRLKPFTRLANARVSTGVRGMFISGASPLW